MGLTAALATAGRSLELATTGIQVAGHNISNANTPGYIREELLIAANLPYPQGSLIFGTGAIAIGIRQQIDTFLESRVHTANAEFHSADTLRTIYKQLEGAIGELGTADVSSGLNRFLGAIHDLIAEPESDALRQTVVAQAEQFAGDVTALRQRVDDLRTGLSGQVQSTVAEANRLIEQISELNKQITRLEAAGLLASDAGTLRTQRYTALNRLSEIVPVKFVENPDGSVNVFAGSDYLILGERAQRLVTSAETDRGIVVHSVTLSETGSDLSRQGGELFGLIEGRDTVLGGFVDSLDALAAGVIREFNRIHSSGEGPKRQESVTGTYRALDSAAALNESGLPFAVEHGGFQIKLVNASTGLAETHAISIDLDGIGTDTSLNDLRAALDGIANLTASITADGRLSLSAAAGFELAFANDTSGVLAAVGINTFFTGTNAGTIAVNPLVRQDHRLFAAGQGGGPADNRNAVLLAQFTENATAALGNVSIDSYYESLITRVAQESASQTAIASGRQGFRDSLLYQRDQYSGVNLDEEALKMLDFQRAYQASARMISLIDELYQTLLNI
ncbi:MAG: flagellar hook-associated protein FlgK [Planctomycetaceae bacterium]